MPTLRIDNMPHDLFLRLTVAARMNRIPIEEEILNRLLGIVEISHDKPARGVPPMDTLPVSDPERFDTGN